MARRVWIAAFTGGVCGGCDEDINEDDECVYGDDEGEILHLRCAEDAEMAIDYD